MSVKNSSEQFKLSETTSDTVSRVAFPQLAGSNQLLAVTSWDCKLRIFDITVNSLRCTHEYPAPILDCYFPEENRVYSVGLNSSLNSFDIVSGQDSLIGKHENAIKSVLVSKDINSIITGSWDHTARLWDIRISHSLQGGALTLPTHTLAHQAAIYSMDSIGYKLLVGTAQRKLYVWDLRALNQPLVFRDSPLKYQTRCVKCFPNGQGFVVSSIEGRICVESFDTSLETQKRGYAFKCHRQKTEEEELVYSVNCIAFHNRWCTFASGGSDCCVNIWDAFNQKRLEQLPRFSDPVRSLDFSYDGSVLAVGVAGMNEERAITEVGELRPGTVTVRYVSDHEVQPKPNTSGQAPGAALMGSSLLITGV